MSSSHAHTLIYDNSYILYSLISNAVIHQSEHNIYILNAHQHALDQMLICYLLNTESRSHFVFHDDNFVIYKTRMLNCSLKPQMLTAFMSAFIYFFKHDSFFRNKLTIRNKHSYFLNICITLVWIQDSI